LLQTTEASILFLVSTAYLVDLLALALVCILEAEHWISFCNLYFCSLLSSELFFIIGFSCTFHMLMNWFHVSFYGFCQLEPKQKRKQQKKLS